MGNHALPSWPIKRAVQRSGSRRHCGKVLSQEIRDNGSAPAILTFHCLDRFVCQRRNFWCQDDKIILVRALDCYHLLELLCRNVKLDKTGLEFALCVYHHQEFARNRGQWHDRKDVALVGADWHYLFHVWRDGYKVEENVLDSRKFFKFKLHQCKRNLTKI